MRAVFILFFMGAMGAGAWPSNRFKIPNGHRIPCVDGMEGCSADGLCQGFGHTTCAGGVPSWNKFGQDFRRNGNKWNRTLCEKDSDGDGVSNGVELGSESPICRGSGVHPHPHPHPHPRFAGDRGSTTATTGTPDLPGIGGPPLWSQHPGADNH
jgi:hypothetical protein